MLVLRFGPVIRVIRPRASVVTGGCISRNDSSHKKMDSEHEEHEELLDKLEERVVGDFFSNRTYNSKEDVINAVVQYHKECNRAYKVTRSDKRCYRAVCTV